MDFKRYIPEAFSRYDFQRVYSGAESETYIGSRELNDDYRLFKRSSIWENVAKDLSLLRNIVCIGFGRIREISPEGIFRGISNDWRVLFDKTKSFISSSEVADVITLGTAKLLRDYWSENENKSCKAWMTKTVNQAII